MLGEKSIGAHQIILKLHAGTYFEPILGHKFTEQNSVMLKEFSLDAIKLYLDYVYIGENVLHDENVDLGQFYEFAQFFQNDILVSQILDIFNCRCNSKDLYPRPELRKIISALQIYMDN